MGLDSDVELQDSSIRLRQNPEQLKEKVRIGCGAGFAGDRPSAAVKLLRRVDNLDYIVLECLAERTLADRYQSIIHGGKGYDPKISEWMEKLLPITVEKSVCVITNIGAMDPVGAQRETLNIARKLGLSVNVAIAYEVSVSSRGAQLIPEGMEGGASTYLGAAPIVQCLEKYKPHVVITSRVADAALFLAPMVYELGWNWNNYELLAQGALAGHLLECGCQLTGGYFMHPGDENRTFSQEQLLDISLPYAEISHAGEVFIGKAEGSGGRLDFSTCAQQLLYEIGDPASYITPDVVIDLQDVTFCPLSENKVLCHGAKASNLKTPDKLLRLVPLDCGWKGWGEISYGGYGCLNRAEAAEYLVRSWMEETYPEVKDSIISYVIGYDSIKATNNKNDEHIRDIRLRMDGLFELKEHASRFIDEFIALYTNGPAGGGGVITGNRKEIILQKELVDREQVFWTTSMKQTTISTQHNFLTPTQQSEANQTSKNTHRNSTNISTFHTTPAPSNKKILLHEVAHSRAGDKGNDINFSLIPHFPQDIERLKSVITPNWVKNVVSILLDASSFVKSKAITWKIEMLEKVKVEIYEVGGINSLNVVVRNMLDGGVNCSRRIDRHGKTMSDLILCQEIMLPPFP